LLIIIILLLLLFCLKKGPIVLSSLLGLPVREHPI
jgi:hypothetical protein